jgi:sorbitol/mannitol transport system substrate-binding protein
MFLRALSGILLLILFSNPLYAENKSIRLVAYELNPYVSKDRSEHGYLFDITIKAFEAAGYRVEVEFYPPLRAKKMVESGERDALIPSYSSTADAMNLIFSQPILGTQIGYIQLRDSKADRVTKNGNSMASFNAVNLENFAGPSHLSGQNASSLESLFGEEEGVIKSSSDRIIRLIELLSSKRITMALVDKLQFTDVLVNKRPSLIDELKFLTPSLATKDFHVAFSRKNPRAAQHVAAFDRGLASLQKNGDYASTLMRYGYQFKTPDANTLTIGAVKNADTERMKELSEHFLKDHPKAKIQWYLLEENLLRRVVLASLALHENLFDLITITAYDTAIYARNEWIEPFATESADNQDYIPSIKSTLSPGGKLFALPFYGESSMTYFRKDLFAKAGLTMPAQLSYPQLKAYAEKLHDPAHGVYGICLRGKPGWGENITFYATMANAFGGDWFDHEQKPTLDSKPWIQAGRLYVDLLHNYGPPNAHDLGYLENLKLFAEGRCALWIDATVAVAYLLDPAVSKVSKQLGYAKAPRMLPDRSSHWISTWAFAVPRNSTNSELAKNFSIWASSRKYAQLVAREKGWLQVPPGTRLSTHRSGEYQEVAPFSTFVLDEIQTAIPANKKDAWGNPSLGSHTVGIPEFTAIGTSVGINLSRALQKEMSIERAMELSQNEAKLIMRSSRCNDGSNNRLPGCLRANASPGARPVNR